MKKIMAVAIGLAVIAGAAYAQTQTFSKNAVGFITKSLEKGKLYALTIPFNNMESEADDSWVFVDTDLAKAAPYESKVYFWSKEGQQWASYKYNKLTKKWTCPATTAVKVGECFFFQPADDMPTATVSGEVPDEAVSVPIMGGGALSAVAVPYPVETVFTETDLAKNAAFESKVYFWSEEGQQWASYKYNKLTKKWTCPAGTVVRPGEGFFFQSTSGDAATKEWEEVKPYEFP